VLLAPSVALAPLVSRRGDAPIVASSPEAIEEADTAEHDDDVTSTGLTRLAIDDDDLARD
jgi:hypothetical protein